MLHDIESHFSTVPDIDTPRSIFDYSHDHLTSFNIGELVPIGVYEVLPGDTWKVTTSTVARLQTLLTPMMGNVYVDIMAFYVPMRLTWTHTKEFFGENTAGAWAPQTTYSIPKLESPTNGWNVGTIADHMGIPPLVEFKSVNNGGDGVVPSALPVRAYALICNEWFRDENLTDPLNIPTGDATQSGSNGTNYITDVANGGALFKVAKLHDMFTSCLPDPQKNRNPVTFPLINNSKAEVYAGSTAHGHATSNIKFSAPGVTWLTSGSAYDAVLLADSGSTGELWGSGSTTGAPAYSLTPNNLYADLASSVGSVTVNQLRLAFQMQKFYEQQARGGSRYREQIRSMFGTTVPDARVQVPEYLGGNRFPLSIHQVANTTASQSADLGDLGAMSNTSDIHDTFVKSFTEHGYIVITACARYEKSYPQGLDRMWTRDNYFDFAWPCLSCIGEQPIFKYEVDATVRAGEDRTEVFGYNEAWIHYRTHKNMATSEMRPGVPNSLASWHLADYYTSMPNLSDGWIREDKSNVDRVLAVTSAVANQIFADFWFDISVTRCLPTFSVPGLIDHF